MKAFITRHAWLLAALAIVAVSNTVMLCQIYANRQGGAESRIELSERELPYVSHQENSGISLRLLWRNENKNWLSPEKMHSLGFFLPEQIDDDAYRYSYWLSHPVFLVLEYNGAAYQENLARLRKELEDAQISADKGEETQRHLKYAQSALDDEINCKSRLFVIDASLDRKTLRAQYPDRQRYLIVHGSLRPDYSRKKDDSSYELTASGINVSISDINVPQRWSAPFANIEPQTRRYYWRNACNKDEEIIRYHVELSYGQRLEPWVESITTAQ